MQQGHAETVHVLVLECAVNVDVRNNYDMTALCSAAAQGKCGTMRALVKLGAVVDIKDNGGQTPLHQASLGQHTDAMRCLVTELKADLNLRDAFGFTPLEAVAEQGNVRALRELVALGTQLNDDRGWCGALNIAAGGGHGHAVRYLIQVGAQVVHAVSRGGSSMRDLLVLSGRASALRYLDKVDHLGLYCTLTSPSPSSCGSPWSSSSSSSGVYDNEAPSPKTPSRLAHAGPFTPPTR